MLIIEEVTLSHCMYEMHLQLIDMDKNVLCFVIDPNAY